MATTKDSNASEQDHASSIDETLRRLPDGGDSLATVHDATAEKMLELAEQLVSQARERLGPETSKPRVVEVARLFFDHAGQAPEVTKKLNEDLRLPDRIEQVAALDETWDKATAGAVNAFDQTSIEAGSKVQENTDNWRLAVRVYESEARSAGAIFEAKIKRAQQKQGNQLGTHAELDKHVDYYSRSADISAALVQYEQAMSSASSELGKALGVLIEGLFESAASVSVAEATFLNSSQTASTEFWSGVQSELDNRS